MNVANAGEITILLRAWSEGDDQALERLTPLVYKELYRAAQRCMAYERPGHLLQSTALVNEVYLSLSKVGRVAWEDRHHFFAFCAQSMRHILVDHARAQNYRKRGGGFQRVPLTDTLPAPQDDGAALLALDEALECLAIFDERKHKVVELRFFAGLSVRETAELLAISEDTVLRDWKFAKDWLLSRLETRPAGAPQNGF